MESTKDGEVAEASNQGNGVTTHRSVPKRQVKEAVAKPAEIYRGIIRLADGRHGLDGGTLPHGQHQTILYHSLTEGDLRVNAVISLSSLHILNY